MAITTVLIHHLVHYVTVNVNCIGLPSMFHSYYYAVATDGRYKYTGRSVFFALLCAVSATDLPPHSQDSCSILLCSTIQGRDRDRLGCRRRGAMTDCVRISLAAAAGVVGVGYSKRVHAAMCGQRIQRDIHGAYQSR